MTFAARIEEAFSAAAYDLENIIGGIKRNRSDLWLAHEQHACASRPWAVNDGANSDECVARFETSKGAVDFMYTHQRLHGSTLDYDSMREHCAEASDIAVANEEKLRRAFEVLR